MVSNTLAGIARVDNPNSAPGSCLIASCRLLRASPLAPALLKGATAARLARSRSVWPNRLNCWYRCG